jgi:EF hand
MPPANRRTLITFVLLAMLAAPGASFGQAPPGNGKEQPKPLPDEFRALLKEVEEAYKAPLEVDKDVLDELRKQYRSPSPEREVKIFKEIRRLYATNPEIEEAILVELRRAYQQPSVEQEERVFAAIRRGGQLPPGTVPASIQAEQATKLFRKLDQNGDGMLSGDEMPDTLRGQLARWDQNGDKAIEFAEYWPYYQAHLKHISDGVASGEIPLKLPKGAILTDTSAARAEEPRPAARAAGQPQPKLPDWFYQYDLDGDGQVGLYEWRKKGGAIKDFLAMDRNGDGFLEAKELLAFLAEQQSRAGAKSSPRR